MAFQDGLSGQIINIGPDEEFVSINTLAKTIAELINFKLEPRYFPERPQEIKNATCSADKARKLLGYKTEYTLKKGLKEMIYHIRKDGTKQFKYHIDLEIINEKTPKTWKERLL